MIFNYTHQMTEDSKDIPKEDKSENESEKEVVSKVINLISFGYCNGKPELSLDDLLFSVEDMFTVGKKIRDEYSATRKEFQNALFDIEANSDSYDEIFSAVIDNLREFLESGGDEINIYIGCEKGKQQSVGTICRLSDDIKNHELIKNKIGEGMDIDVNVSHRDLIDDHRRSKKTMNNRRSQNRDRKYRNGW
jgi:RNase adaptor protein for sRNA GlmZ degradation